MSPRANQADYRAWGAIALVGAGGGLGTLVRLSLDQITPSGVLVFTTLGINVAGSFALGFLYTALTDGDRAPAVQKRLRQFLGTGFMGGFTTYSSFAVAVAVDIRGGDGAEALAYASASLLLGPIAAWAGQTAALRLNGSRPRRSTHVPKQSERA